MVHAPSGRILTVMFGEHQHAGAPTIRALETNAARPVGADHELWANADHPASTGVCRWGEAAREPVFRGGLA
jgi:hypothetical protein